MNFWKTLWRKYQGTSQVSNNTKNIHYHTIIQDFHYKNKKITIFLNTNKEINLYALEKLCDTVGWVRRPLKKVKLAIDNSLIIFSLFYTENKEKRLIAFARATSDNTFNATIWDVVVHPQFQRQGLGKILINEIINHLRSADINTITLFADPHVVKFYRDLGFISDPDEVKGMFWYPN
uniref:GCN5-like N-acetyltransferase n=1 Tax=Porolithon onkodes TaxID=231751 RepID=A0A2Z2KSC6_9FLOR|nr:GCN5-like N-acetyltransferase [Porolithon onkodes]ASB29649.1 GCN5-like N-acetyltransferase [Porolithon onkodes]